MSVIKSKRDVSRYDYAYRFIRLYEYTEEKLSKMAKRKYHWLAAPIAAKMNRMRDEIMQIFDPYYENGKTLQEQCLSVIKGLLSLQKPLLALWNIEGYTEKRMEKWISLIEMEIDLLADLGGFKKRESYMFILDHEAVNRLDCFGNMSRLHKMIYTKSISLPGYCRETKGSYLMELADTALYHMARGNRKIPETKEEYENRKKDFSRAMNCIRSMEQPMFAVFNLMNYSNETMEEIAALITETGKLLKGLMDSDEERFGALP